MKFDNLQQKIGVRKKSGLVDFQVTSRYFQLVSSPGKHPRKLAHCYGCLQCGAYLTSLSAAELDV